MKIVLLDKKCKPYRKHETDAGLDLRVRKGFAIEPHQTLIVPSGIKIALPKGTYADIKPRSSIFKRGIQISGVIDENYRGEVGIMIHNMTNHFEVFAQYDRIAQMIIKKYETVEFEVVDELNETERGDGGFGSTGR